jgi:EmrB/QacA subfamily drug resistance transporter
MPKLPEHWRVFTVVTSAVAMASMDGGMIPLVFSDMRREFAGTPQTTLAWVFTAYSIGLASFVVAAGRLADRTGRRRMFLLGTSLFVLGSGLCAIAPTPGLLIAARFVQGSGHAIFTPASLGLILVAWPDDRRTAAIAAWITVGGISSGVGPTLGALIVRSWNWRVAFAVNVVIGVPTLWRALRLKIDTEKRSDALLPDPVGIVLLSTSLACVALAIVQGRTWGWTDQRILGATVAAVVLGTLFAWRSKGHPAPVLDMNLLRGRTYRLSLLVSMLVTAPMNANLVMQPRFLEDAWHYSKLHAGLAVSPLPVLAGLTAPVASRYANRYGHRSAILFGISLTSLGLLGYAVLPGADPHYWLHFFPGVALAGIGTWGFAISMINAAAVTDMSTENFGVGVAILQTFRQIGGMLGTALFFGLYGASAPGDALGTLKHIWLIFSVPPMVGLLLATRYSKGLGRAAPVPATAPATGTAAPPART